MSKIIASTYEIIGNIGIGGGGNVYLANHIRLNKKVVLKADRRKLATRPEALRREVDTLKDLRHTYIPQVYDFFDEGGIVYTVMDYIEGESLDKPLKRGEKFSQPQIVQWARELLEALCYLHSPTHGTPPRGFTHSDIKPSNVMRTPYGSICLIDFNIALALGEDNVIGKTDGYSSPEHYGLDYSTSGDADISDNTTASNTTALSATASNATASNATASFQKPDGEAASLVKPMEETEYIGLTEDAQAVSSTVSPAASSVASSGASSVASTGASSVASSSRKAIVPDARSDIYSVGALLYHLLSGSRPAKNAMDVAPLPSDGFNPQIVRIIAKAMNPNPNLRYQTAEDMLQAFDSLWVSDPRMARLKRSRLIAGIALAALLAAGAFTSFVGLARIGKDNEALAYAEYSKTALAEGDQLLALDYALEALPPRGSIFAPPHMAKAKEALADALGVYDLSDGYKPFNTLEFPSEVIKLAISPSEKYAAAMSLGVLVIFDIDSGEKLAELPTVDSALADVAFIGDGKAVFAGMDGLTAYDIAARQPLWTGRLATAISVSADGSRIAAVYRDEDTATVYGADGKAQGSVPFGGRHLSVLANDRLADPKDSVLSLNKDGTLLAVSFSDGGLSIFDLRDRENDIDIYDGSGYSHFEGGFSGKYFVFSATSGEESVFAAIDTVELEQTDSLAAPERIGVAADESGVYLAYRDKRVKYDPATYAETAPGDGREPPVYSFEHSIDSPVVKISKLESNAGKEILRYDSFYAHDEARVSADGETSMLFSIYGFRIYNAGGELVAEAKLEEPGTIYDQQYRRDGGQPYLEVTYYSGAVRKYSAVDGRLLAEEQTAPPDESLYEEYYTDTLRIASPLHGAPAAYDLKSGKLVRELEKDAYLAYATQCGENGEYVVAEYISAADGSRYGMLIDGKTCETLARLPNLCDVVGDRLVFDISPGSLRETRIFQIKELVQQAHERIRG